LISQSRGLGDVYKRQGLSSIALRVAILKGSLKFNRRERGGNIAFTLPI
jgi:hypothetical protein